MLRLRKLLGIALGMILLVAPTIGCAKTEKSSGERPDQQAISAHRAWIDEVLFYTENETLIAALEDSWISEAELAESIEHLKSCLEVDGYESNVFVDGGGYGIGYTMAAQEKMFEDMKRDQAAKDRYHDGKIDSCTRSSWFQSAVDLYIRMRINPHAEPNIEVYRRCAIDAGFPEAGNLTDDDLFTLLDKIGSMPADESGEKPDDRLIACYNSPPRGYQPQY